ncbi:hypothetical protein SBOR_9722 [Sclerotinia borealis F-4128]|uniref:Uncharacterized protein n=1 Tax=Sclerotinia borealis (strain F-4128) TaxID=1432307 RepID=W9BZA6_SCLBF|nr:hypothetical protein SBOR_9722 [Sclerotinia borealis F-4128]
MDITRFLPPVYYPVVISTAKMGAIPVIKFICIDNDTLEDFVAATFDDTRDTAIAFVETLLERARDMAAVFVLGVLELDV